MQFLRGSSTGAGTLMFTTGGTERLRIKSDGKIDIGGSTKTGNAARLTVTHTNNSGVGLIDMDAYGSATLQIRSNWSGGTINGMPNETFGIGTPHAYPLVFTTSGNERFRIGPSGQFGLSGTNYGTSGQVLTSQGNSATPTWTTISGTTINNNANNRIITGSGTANTLEGESTAVSYTHLTLPTKA